MRQHEIVEYLQTYKVGRRSRTNRLVMGRRVQAFGFGIIATRQRIDCQAKALIRIERRIEIVRNFHLRWGIRSHETLPKVAGGNNFCNSRELIRHRAPFR